MEPKICPTCQTSYTAQFEVCPEDGSLLLCKVDSRFRGNDQEGEKDSAGKDEWPAGTVIGGKYAILSKVGSRFRGKRQEGEAETVSLYRVRSLEWDEPRCLRVLETGLAGNAAAREFRRTARLLLKLDHPNVVAVEATGDAEDGRPFLATELAEGQTLAELMRAEGPLDPLRVCSISLQIAAALESAHDLGLLHLGLSAPNILLSGAAGRERVKVQGFGAAYVRASRVRPVRNGRRNPPLALLDLIPAYPSYAAPEQALGRSPELLDARADVYSLGVLMYEMLAGRLPFWSSASSSGPTEMANSEVRLASLVSHLEDPPLPLASGGSPVKLPEPFTALVMALLEKRPELRPATARIVIEKITFAGDRLASRSLPDARPQPGREEARPSGIVKPTGAAGAVGAEAVGAVAIHEMPASVGAVARFEETPIAALVSNSSSEAALEALILPAAAGPASLPGAGPVRASNLDTQGDRPVPAAAPAASGLEAQPSWLESSFILFKTALPPEPAHRGRAVWAVLAILLIAAGAWFFITRGRQQWLGSGPLNPMKPDELRTVEGANAVPSAVSPQSSSAPAAASPPKAVASQPSSAAPPGSLTPPASALPSSGLGTAGQSSAAGNSALASPSAAAQASAPSGAAQAPASAGPSPRLEPPSQARARPPPTKPVIGRADLAAEVHRSVTAGDLFFGLGQYDLAVQTYERPLKRDPKNKQLLAKILRAQRAKAAEEQYLGQ